MRLAWLDKDHIAANWGHIGTRLYLATRHCPGYDISALYDRLMEGTAIIFKASEGADGYLTIAFGIDDDEFIAETTAIVGKFEGGPKERVASMRIGLTAVERALRAGGVKRHRIYGRDYSKLFPDYVPCDGAQNGLEKVL